MSTTKLPDLAMLWESSDPHAALVRRFGFPSVEDASRWVADTLAVNWGIKMISCERLIISAGNALAWLTTDNGPLIAKWSAVSKRYPRLAELARLTAWLDSHGHPVSAPLPSLQGSPQLEVDGLSLGVQSVVDGTLLDVADRGQVHAAGVVLANLHQALADYPDVDRLTALAGRSEPEPLTERITRWLESSTNDHLSTATASLRERLAGLPSDNALPVHLIHNDIRSANVLWGGDRIAAVIDFEEVTVDYSVVDLAHAAVMLGTQFRSWGPVSAETHELVLAGYQSVRPLLAAEEEWLRVLMLWRTMCAVPNGDDHAGWAESVKHQLAGR